MGMNKIKYDKRDKKLYRNLAVVTTIIFALCIFALNLDLDVDNLSSAFYASLMIVATLFLPIISIAMWIMYFDSYAYLKRLEKYGYELPIKKRDYHNDLDELHEKSTSKQHKNPENLEESKESKALAYVSWVVALCMVGYSIFYFVRFSHMLENVAFLGFVCIFIAICWVLLGNYFYKQRKPEKYRDDVDYKSKLKVRKNLVEGLVTIVILLAVTIFGAANIYTMSKYVERSKENPEEVVHVDEQIKNI